MKRFPESEPKKILSTRERIEAMCEQAHAEVDARDERAQQYGKNKAKVSLQDQIDDGYEPTNLMYIWN